MVSEGSVYCTARNCVSTGPNGVPGYHGGIFGGACAYCTAINCINTCSINPVNDLSSGGIFGFGPYGCTASNCYNTGTVGPVQARAIAPWSGGETTITNCYTTNGLIGGQIGATITRCSSNTDGVWKDATASAFLNSGNGLVGGPTTTTSYPAYGTIWYSGAPNTAYFLLSLFNSPPCFLAGARILTPTGYRRVETLVDCDSVKTSDGRTVPIKVFKTKIAKTDEDTAPFVIEKGAISRNVPDEDLHVSGSHVIQDARGVWQIPAGLATHPGSGVYQHLPGRPITYYHVECPNFFTDNLVANNCVVESFRNKQGTSENSYEYDVVLGGFVRVMEDEIKNSTSEFVEV